MAQSFGARFLLSCALSILCATAAVAHAKPSKQWTLTSLGGSYAATVNNRGDIGGYARVSRPPGSFPPFANHAVIWQNGVMQDLGTTFGTPPGSGFSNVASVNDRGTFVMGTPEGVMTFRDGLFTPLGFQGAPLDINSKGAIVGAFGTGSGSHAFVYRDGVLQDLGTLGGTNSQANAINDHGLIVGQSALFLGGQRGFIYTDGVMKALQTFGGGDSAARDVNDHGIIVGSAQDQTGRYVAFVTDESGVLRPFLDVPGNQFAAAINNRGAIVGSVDGRGFLYDDGELMWLDDIPGVKEGWWFLIPTGINDRGWIVGTGNRRGGSFTGEAFVLAPR